MRTRIGLRTLCFLTLIAAALCGLAEDTPAVLRPPKGAQVAIVVFEDLECPMCSKTVPQLEKASKDYKIPLVRHDFLIPSHNWSTQAAIIARYFDAHSQDLGDEFRDYIFQNQIQITPFNLRSYAEKFAKEHKADIPFVIDRDDKFAAEAKADTDIGKSIHVQHTPTVYIVSSKNPKRPYVEVKEPASELYARIDEMMKK